MSKPTSTADGIAWNLGDLYRGVDDPRILQDLAQAKQRAERFEATYRGKINPAGGPASQELALRDQTGRLIGKIIAPEEPTPQLVKEALDEFASLSEQADKTLVYAMLLHAAKTDDPKHGALVAKTREERTSINKHLIFFDLEWMHLPDAPAKRVMDDPQLAFYRHYLELKRAWRPHTLSEPEEKLNDAKTLTGRAAFVRLFDETVSTLTFPYEWNGGKDTLTLQQILSKLYDPNRDVRKAAAAGITAGLRENSRLLTYIFNTLVFDHQSDTELRHFPGPMAARHLSNEITDEVVAALMTATERYHGTVARYYRLKAKLLGLDRLYDYDRYAPLSGETPSCPWDTAQEVVQDSYTAFSPKSGEVIRSFFAKRWIDAELRTGKRGGAFSSSAVPSVHPYILMNYTDKLRDVMTLAHELGHGLHQYLSRPQGYLQCDTPLTTAETASVFGEMLTFQQLLARYPEPRTRLALLCSKLEDGFATVFRQVVLTRFEQQAHKARKEQGELTSEQINALWMAANQPMFGDSVTLTDDYGWWWLYIGHFIHSPFYCYAYAFGELLVLALFQKYKQEGQSFVPKYLDLLAAGGSLSPPHLLRKLDVDINDPNFWSLGLKLLDDMVTEAERLASQLA
jgi:oligoendopeptidase F